MCIVYLRFKPIDYLVDGALKEIIFEIKSPYPPPCFQAGARICIPDPAKNISIVIVVVVVTIVPLSWPSSSSSSSSLQAHRRQRHVEELFSEESISLLFPLHNNQHTHRKHVEQDQKS